MIQARFRSIPGRVWQHTRSGLAACEAVCLPTTCLLCNAPAGAIPNLCDPCRGNLPWLDRNTSCPHCSNPGTLGRPCGGCIRSPPPFTAARAAFSYSSPMDHLIARLKYHNCRAAARTLGQLLADALADAGHRERTGRVLVVPIPLHSSRLARRGYNQAMRIATVLVRRLALECAADLLVRVRDTAPQASVTSVAERAANLDNAFVARSTRGVAGRQVALLDDVMTSTSTARAAASALLDVGAASVEVWAVARATQR